MAKNEAKKPCTRQTHLINDSLVLEFLTSHLRPTAAGGPYHAVRGYLHLKVHSTFPLRDRLIIPPSAYSLHVRTIRCNAVLCLECPPDIQPAMLASVSHCCNYRCYSTCKGCNRRSPFQHFNTSLAICFHLFSSKLPQGYYV